MTFAFQLKQQTALIETFKQAIEDLELAEDTSLSPDLEPRADEQPAGFTCRQLLVEIPNSHAAQFWESVRQLVGRAPFDALLSSLIVVCEGEHGWDDYLLLYHYDGSQKVCALS